MSLDWFFVVAREQMPRFLFHRHAMFSAMPSYASTWRGKLPRRLKHVAFHLVRPWLSRFLSEERMYALQGTGRTVPWADALLYERHAERRVLVPLVR